MIILQYIKMVPCVDGYTISLVYKLLQLLPSHVYKSTAPQLCEMHVHLTIESVSLYRPDEWGFKVNFGKIRTWDQRARTEGVPTITSAKSPTNTPQILQSTSGNNCPYQQAAVVWTANQSDCLGPLSLTSRGRFNMMRRREVWKGAVKRRRCGTHKPE